MSDPTDTDYHKNWRAASAAYFALQIHQSYLVGLNCPGKMRLKDCFEDASALGHMFAEAAAEGDTP